MRRWEMVSREMRGGRKSIHDFLRWEGRLRCGMPRQKVYLPTMVLLEG
jgi:predicted SAM-dependent methyltransferase